MEAAFGDDLMAARARRFRLEHAQIMTQDDLKRAVKLGGQWSGTPQRFELMICASPPVIASYQPTHATSDVRS